MLDASAPAILQIFESTYENTEQRAADLFHAGYGAVWIPPTGRADSGNFSVGYDVYDRFDLGGPGNPTLYGTETGLKTLVDVLHDADFNVYADFIPNHNGFRDLSTPDFVAQGGYPGFALTLNAGNNSQGYDDIDGDFHSVFSGGDLEGRLAGLNDIAQEKNYQLIRHPVDPADNRNLPAGTIANQPDPSNTQFYPDRDLDPIMLFDPTTGESDIPVYPFNTSDPGAGDPIPENALGLIMRNAQWMIQEIGVDGFRLDAAKHFPDWVLNFLDRAVYRAIQTPLLDGSTEHTFMFSEIFSSDKAAIQNLIRKDINPNDPGRIGGNRDALDFPLFFAMRDNLTGNGIVNDWRDIKNASQDVQDDGLANNGSQGVAFVNSHDEEGAHLSNVAHAYVLMRPGNAIVYFNAEQFGDGRDFPKDGRGDAVGGQFGETITKLVGIRNTHGRGNYIDRTPGADEKEMLIFERDASSLVVLSNRLDAGFDSRTIQTNFAPGTPLVDLTGNAANGTIDPFNDFPEVLVVNQDGTVNLRVPRNVAPNGTHHDTGYFIYGPSGPQGALSLTNVSATLNGSSGTPETNGTTRVAGIDVISADAFDVQLDTFAVNHLGSVRDQFADGDNALLKLDSGIDLNGNGFVDFVGGGGVSTGFEEFVTQKEPGFFEADGNGTYRQTIDATTLSEGMHFLEVRAFRHREPGEGDAIYSSFKKSIYVDRLPPESQLVRFDPIVAGINQDRRLEVRHDLTGDNIHAFLNLPAGLSDAEVIAMLDGNSQANKVDRDLFTKDFGGLTHGNHVITTVTFEMSGNVNVQRFPGQFTSTIFGAGLGDLDVDGDVDPDDMAAFEAIYLSENDLFNPAADFNGDGLVDINDLPLLYQLLVDTGNTGATFDRFDQFVVTHVPVDYGDAEDSFGTLQASSGPHHILVGGPVLGIAVDADADGQPTSNAQGDDADGGDDEDGLVTIGTLMAGAIASATITASEPALVDAWIDFDGNGLFDHPAEHLDGGTSIAVDAGSNDLGINVPASAVSGDTAMRIRISSSGNLLPTRLAGDGEVEDYSVSIGAAPTVETITVNDGATQRSRVDSVTVSFDSQVDIDDSNGDPFRFINKGTGQAVADVPVVSIVDGKTVVRFTFTTGPSVHASGTLLDGDYQLTIDASRISRGGASLDGNGDGANGDDRVFGEIAADNFYRKYGDRNGNGIVDLFDFAAFRGTYNKPLADPAFLPEFDNDGNGAVNLFDFAAFRSNFGS